MRAGAVNPADALDEAKVGVAAKFVSIKPSEFEMGSPKDEKGRYADEIQHPVKLTKGYEMQATAVTQLQYFMVMGRNPSTFRKQENCDANNFKVVYGLGLCVNHPVENVSWDDAQAFIAQLNKTQSKYTYRLPTEAEWENATRAALGNLRRSVAKRSLPQEEFAPRRAIYQGPRGGPRANRPAPDRR